MDSRSLLRRFGWKQQGGKWIAPGHSRPLTQSQAKAALARDLKTKDFKSALDALERGYTYSHGKFQKGKTKPKSLEAVEKEIKRDLNREFNSDAKALGFKSKADADKISRYIKNDPTGYYHYVDQYRKIHGSTDRETRAELARLYYEFKTSRKDSRQKLDRLLMRSGWRTGREPWLAGDTPRRKRK